MKECQGFFILEGVIYLILLMVLTSLVFGAIMPLYRRIREYQERNDARISMIVAGDCWVTDVRLAPASPTYWKKIRDEELIWHTGVTDIGWRKRDHRLERLQGTYEPRRDQWIKVNTALVLSAVEHLSFTVQFRNNGNRGEVSIVSLTVQSAHESVPMIKVSSPRNRSVGAAPETV